MIDLPLLLAFLLAAFILTVTPGTDTAMVLRAATVEGRRSAVAASAGILLGCLVWGGVVSLGLGALLAASELAYTTLKLAGGAYLLWLGVKLVLKPRQSLDAGTADDEAAKRGRNSFWRGLMTNLLNPKIGVFFITFLPQFVPAGANVAAYSFFLAVIYMAMTSAWFAALIAATVPLGHLLRRPPAVRVLDRVTGGVFVAFGLKLATSTSRVAL